MLPLVKRVSKKEFEIVLIDDDNDVIQIFMEDGVLRYQTRDGEIYKQIVLLEEAEKYAQMKGFERLDRCFLAKTDSIAYYNADNHNAYYESHPASKEAPYTPVSKKYEKVLEEKGIPFITEDSKSQEEFGWSKKSVQGS